jgi:FkbM family methyltransferase
MEDVHLAIAFEGQEIGFYADIGAGHPVADNVSLWFYERGWRGIIAEPQGALCRLYPAIRPRDSVYEGLVGRENGLAPFFQFEKLHGLSTTVADHAETAREVASEYAVIQAPITTLASLFERHGAQHIDFLKIDVEGAEGDVLAGNDWTRYRPKIVVAEAVSPGRGEPNWQEWEPLLFANGYRFRLFDTLNRFYVAEEHPDIFERLPAERAPWHSVTHMYEIGRAPENARHPDHALAKALQNGLFASLPFLSEEKLREILRLAGEDVQLEAITTAGEEALRIALGRIACGYDGGQVFSSEE